MTEARSAMATSHINSDLRGAGRLAIAATLGVTDLVEAMHRTIASVPAPIGKPREGPARGIAGLVYSAVRGTTRVVGGGLDAALALLPPMLGDAGPWPMRTQVLAALNGILGDYLVQTGNPLAIPMQLRSAGRTLEIERTALAAALPRAAGKLLVMVHGLCMSDLQWNRAGHDHGAALAQALGYTPVYLNYNTGRHVSTNGRELADLLERLVREWPVALSEVTIVGHSMGGLVARSAAHARSRTVMPGGVSFGAWSFSARPTTARRSSAADTGWTWCSASARTPWRSIAWVACAAPESPICVTAASSTRTGRDAAVSRTAPIPGHR